ncbi:Uncharacterized protein FWK35_00025763, partial [Aphis craccivora]
QHLWGFPLFHLALLAFFTFPPAGRKNITFQRLNRGRKPNFRCRREKNIIFFVCAKEFRFFR